jgi:Rps23 Pro-64 3,4-dihydroxylase Tpa1-like proline 4-hydroxylase
MDHLNFWRPWIEERHLRPASLTAYRASFEEHPARLVVINDFLRTDVAERLAIFLRDEAQFQQVFGLYSREGAMINREEWLRAEEKDRFFRFSKIAGLPPQYGLSPNTLTYLQFRKTLQATGFASLFEQLTGVALAGSEAFSPHSMERGDFLKVHNDKIGNRQLALVFYLTPGWEPDFGGALVVVDCEGRKTRIEAEYNRLVAFDVNVGTTHFIEEIKGVAQDQRRLTISGWYDKGR